MSWCGSELVSEVEASFGLALGAASKTKQAGRQAGRAGFGPLNDRHESIRFFLWFRPWPRGLDSHSYSYRALVLRKPRPEGL